MLTYDDNPTIRHSILKRLGKEPGVKIADIQIVDCQLPPAGDIRAAKAHVPHIAVGVWIILVDTVRGDGDAIVDLRSFFDLPPEFELRQVHDEIDEIAEACKRARTETTATRLLHIPGVEHQRKALPGTGTRGRWND